MLTRIPAPAQLGICLSVLLAGRAWAEPATRYVDAKSANPTPPYTNWTTAATVIQHAVDVASPGDEVLVANGLYSTGGREGSRVHLRVPIALRSVNGPSATVIRGYQTPDTFFGPGAIQCVYLTNGASISGFTLTHGAAVQFGGGMLAEPWSTATASNCVFAGNCASFGGGGAHGGRLVDCILTNNWSFTYGGGVDASDLDRCFLAYNTAQSGGGAEGGNLTNCVLWQNTATQPQWSYRCGGGAALSFLVNCTVVSNYSKGPGVGGLYQGWSVNSIIRYNRNEWFPWEQSDVEERWPSINCCQPYANSAAGLGEAIVTAEPLFVNLQTGDLRLQTNSPCINSGRNDFLASARDLAHSPRIVSGTADIGAYEYQGRGSVISYDYLQKYYLPTDGSADWEDPDGDGMNNFQEWRCATDPASERSVLRMLSVAADATNLVVSWRSVANKEYVLERATSLIAGFATLATVRAVDVVTAFTDTNSPAARMRFYRVGVR